jgi:tRNA(fMet)-specific endonuclease VapC
VHQQEIAISAISWHELLYEFHRLPDSPRKSRVQYFIEQTVYPNIPIVPFDDRAAEQFAKERARLTKDGLSPPFADGQIAAIGMVNDLIIVTRNIKDFANFNGILLEDWFEAVK